MVRRGRQPLLWNVSWTPVIVAPMADLLHFDALAPDVRASLDVTPLACTWTVHGSGATCRAYAYGHLIGVAAWRVDPEDDPEVLVRVIAWTVERQPWPPPPSIRARMIEGLP